MVKDAGFDRPAGGAAFDVSTVPRGIVVHIIRAHVHRRDTLWRI